MGEGSSTVWGGRERKELSTPKVGEEEEQGLGSALPRQGTGARLLSVTFLVALPTAAGTGGLQEGEVPAPPLLVEF